MRTTSFALIFALLAAAPLQAQTPQPAFPEAAEPAPSEEAGDGTRTFRLSPARAWVETLKVLSANSIVPISLDRAGGTVIAEGLTPNGLYVSCPGPKAGVQNVKVNLSVILTADGKDGTMVILIVSGAGDKIQRRNALTERPEKLIPVSCISMGVLEKDLYDALARAAGETP